MAQRMFAMEADDITIQCSDEVTVNVIVSVAGIGLVYENAANYQPVNGIVKLGELGELVNRCIEISNSFHSLASEQRRYASCTLTVGIPDEEIEETAEVLYCRKRVGLSATDILFMTGCRNRRVVPGQHVILYVPNQQGLTIQHKVAYLYNEQVYYVSDTEEPVTGQNTYICIDCSPELELSAVAPSGSTLIYYDVELYYDNELCDRVHCEIDTTYYARKAEWIFINLFGVQESVIMRGNEEDEVKHEASYGYAGTIYRKFDTQLTYERKTNSGWLAPGEWEMLCDLSESPATGIRTGNDITDLVITGAEVKRVNPSNEPEAVTFTWRYKDRVELAPDTKKLFVFERPPFDESFE